MNDVPQDPSQPEEPKLLTITEISEVYGVSRQTVHNLRRRGVFPEPVQEPGTTRLKWPQPVLDAYFEANPKQPGKKLEARQQPPTD